MQQMFEHIFDCLYVGYGINIKALISKDEDIILFALCRYAHSRAFIYYNIFMVNIPYWL